MCLICCLCSHGQGTGDSLWGIWLNDDYSDSTRVWALQKHTWGNYLTSEPDTAFQLAELSYQFAHERNMLYFMGFARLGQGVSFQLRGNKVEALDYFLESISIFEAAKSQNGIAGALNNIGLMYYDMEEYQRAMEYHKRALNLRRVSGDGLGVSGSLTNIGDIHMAREEYDIALNYYERSLAVMDSVDKESFRPGSLDNIGNVYLKMGQYDKARGYFQSCLILAKDINRPLICIESKVRLGQIDLKTARFSEAEEYCLDALKLAESTKNLDWQMHACECLYETYKGLKQTDQALKYLERSKEIEEKLAIRDVFHSLQDMELRKELVLDSLAQYEQQRKANNILQEQIRRSDRTRELWMISGLISILVFGGLWSRLIYIRRSKKTIEEAKQLSDNLLLNILPEEVAEELKKTGKASARQFEDVSILFTDFEQFTETAERLSAVDLVSELNLCFEEFDRICDAYGVEKIKTIGDAYMAAGGLPVPSGESVRNTIMAAITMQEFIQNRSRLYGQDGRPVFEMRAGIHTGPVIAGIVGLRKFQYDIWGDTVNTANRMESYSDTGMVNISAHTYDLVKDDPEFKFRVRGAIDVKGKGHMRMYYVSRKDDFQDE